MSKITSITFKSTGEMGRTYLNIDPEMARLLERTILDKKKKEYYERVSKSKESPMSDDTEKLLRSVCNTINCELPQLRMEVERTHHSMEKFAALVIDLIDQLRKDEESNE
jgi:hypothetical protein